MLQVTWFICFSLPYRLRLLLEFHMKVTGTVVTFKSKAKLRYLVFQLFDLHSVFGTLLGLNTTCI